MGLRGPAKKPAVLKMLDGNPGKKRIQVEVKPTPIAPECPSWLPPFAQEEWNRVSNQLEKLGLLTNVDGSAFEAYCMAYANWKSAQLVLMEKGTTMMSIKGFEMPRPEVAIANQAVKVMKAFITEFGLSPAGRARMSVTPTTGGDDSGEDFFSIAKAK